MSQTYVSIGGPMLLMDDECDYFCPTSGPPSSNLIRLYNTGYFDEAIRLIRDHLDKCDRPEHYKAVYRYLWFNKCKYSG